MVSFVVGDFRTRYLLQWYLIAWDLLVWDLKARDLLSCTKNDTNLKNSLIRRTLICCFLNMAGTFYATCTAAGYTCVNFW